MPEHQQAPYFAHYAIDIPALDTYFIRLVGNRWIYYRQSYTVGIADENLIIPECPECGRSRVNIWSHHIIRRVDINTVVTAQKQAAGSSGKDNRTEGDRVGCLDCSLHALLTTTFSPSGDYFYVMEYVDGVNDYRYWDRISTNTGEWRLLHGEIKEAAEGVRLFVRTLSFDRGSFYEVLFGVCVLFTSSESLLSTLDVQYNTNSNGWPRFIFEPRHSDHLDDTSSVDSILFAFTDSHLRDSYGARTYKTRFIRIHVRVEEERGEAVVRCELRLPDIPTYFMPRLVS